MCVDVGVFVLLCVYVLFRLIHLFMFYLDCYTFIRVKWVYDE